MKTILLVMSALIFCFVINEAEAKSENECLALAMPHDIESGGLYYNPDSVMVDTCSDSPTVHQFFAKKKFDVEFSQNIFYGELAPRGTILKLHQIDSVNFSATKEGFRILQEELGEFWFERNTDTLSGDESKPLFTLYFENYVEVNKVEALLRDINKVQHSGLSFSSMPRSFVSVKDPYEHFSFRIYPNPTSENITISIPQNLSFKNTKLTLRDITGREIILKEIDALQDSYTFSVQEIPTGVYMLEVRSGNEFFTKQVSVIR